MAVELAQLRHGAREADGLPLRLLAVAVPRELGEGVGEPAGRRVHFGYPCFEASDVVLGDLEPKAEVLLLLLVVSDPG